MFRSPAEWSRGVVEYGAGGHGCYETADGCPVWPTGIAISEQQMRAADEGEGERVNVGVGSNAAMPTFVGEVCGDCVRGLGEDRNAAARQRLLQAAAHFVAEGDQRNERYQNRPEHVSQCDGQVARDRAAPDGLAQRRNLLLSSCGPVDHQLGDEGVEVDEVSVQDPLCAACLVRDSPAGQGDRSVSHQYTFGRGEQLLARIAKVDAGRHRGTRFRERLKIGRNSPLRPYSGRVPTIRRKQSTRTPVELYRARNVAESFGTDARRYDNARPSYPEALIARVVAGSPGPDVLDVGCGTGIAARQFQAAGCTVLGVEPDARMAEFARSRGLRVEVATFEAWQPSGRTFDALIAAQSWQWIDPNAGATKAAQVLRPRGQLAIFGHVFEPPAEVAEPFTTAYRRVASDSTFNISSARSPTEAYLAAYARVAETIRETGQFGDIDQWRFHWDHSYTREQWLELLPTTGGLTRLDPSKAADILDSVGRAIDDLGGSFTMTYTTLAVSATRGGPHR
jgi:SAM-dependent methyltransferase